MVRLELDNLYGHCMRLQQEALLTGRRRELVFDTIHQRYEIDKKTYALSPHVMFADPSHAPRPPSQTKGPQIKESGIDESQAGITFVKNKIIFYPDGIISSGTVYLTDKLKKHLYALSVGISQVSFIRRYSYQNGWVLLS